jgi:hypothetical protein
VVEWGIGTSWMSIGTVLLAHWLGAAGPLALCCWPSALCCWPIGLVLLALCSVPMIICWRYQGGHFFLQPFLMQTSRVSSD